MAPVLVAANAPQEVADPREALERLLTLPVVPGGWRQDVRACLGLDPTEIRELALTARRLTMSVLTLLRERFPNLDTHPV